MLSWLLNRPKPKDEEPAPPTGFFSTDTQHIPRRKLLLRGITNNFQRLASDDILEEGMAMDSSGISQLKRLNSSIGQGIPDAQLGWYTGQGFIGYQICALFSQHWLIDKALTMPARDAVRNGYEITVNDGKKLKPEVLAYIIKRDKAFKLKRHCLEFVRKGRMFGIRIAMFLVDSTDEEYYSKPFNIDGVTKGSYKGIVQVDPYWITPELSQEAATNPGSPDFYDPTWWRINGKRIHKSHLVIMRTGEVADILKPTYLYGGIPIPQKIYERVYAAERTANEAPMLAMTKRLITLKADMQAALTNQLEFQQKMELWTSYMNNFGVKVIGGEEEIEQFDTSLNDLDMVIMTQFQLVAAAAEVPSTKLLGTTPKGFNATGEYEEASYHEFLESLQEHDISPLVERHHALLIRSEVMPKFDTGLFEVDAVWNPVDSPTAAEQTDTNLKKAQTDTSLSAAGAIDGVDIRNRLINDKNSGYNGIEPLPASGFPDQDDEEENSEIDE